MEIKLPYEPAIPLLGIYTEETRIERDTCISMFTAVTTARTWDLDVHCRQMDNEVLVHIHNGIFIIQL